MGKMKIANKKKKFNPTHTTIRIDSHRFETALIILFVKIRKYSRALYNIHYTLGDDLVRGIITRFFSETTRVIKIL